jgi:hypothetical protein
MLKLIGFLKTKFLKTFYNFCAGLIFTKRSNKPLTIIKLLVNVIVRVFRVYLRNLVELGHPCFDNVHEIVVRNFVNWVVSTTFNFLMGPIS